MELEEGLLQGVAKCDSGISQHMMAARWQYLGCSCHSKEIKAMATISGCDSKHWQWTRLGVCPTLTLLTQSGSYEVNAPMHM